MSSTGQFSIANSDRSRELKMENYFGNVSNHFSKMHPAECLSNAVDSPCKLEDGSSILQQNLGNKENIVIPNCELLSPILLKDSDKMYGNKDLSQHDSNDLKIVSTVSDDANVVCNEEGNEIGKNGQYSYIIPPIKLNNGNCNDKPFMPKVDELNHLNQRNDGACLKQSATDQKGAPKLLISNGGTDDLTKVGEITARVDGDHETKSALGVDQQLSKALGNEDVKSLGSSKNSLHVQFEEGSDENAFGSEPQMTRESPAFSLTSESSSEGDESSLEDLAEEGRAPDGGYGWVVVAAAFFTNLIADGITFTFGIIYVELLKHFKEGKSKTAWIGGIFMAMPLLSGPVASYLTDRFGCRKVCMCGSVLACIGFVISSQANSIEVLILTFGILSGFGLAMCFVSAVVIVAYYFDKKRSLATGLSVCGSGLGTFIFAPISSWLIQEYGWRGTTLILGGLFLNIMVCGALMRDLEWTKEKMKAQRRDRKMKHRNKRSLKSQSQSLRTATSSVGSLNPSKTLSVDELKRLLQSGDKLIPTLDDSPGDNEEITRLCSSVLHLPTFVRTGEKVPHEVLELLSSNQHMYNVVLKNYPSLLITSRSNSDVGYLNVSPERKTELFNINEHDVTGDFDSATLAGNHAPSETLPRMGTHSRELTPRSLPTTYLRQNNVPRRSLTYRGAMLNVKRYRARAASCPDISRNSMATIPQQSTKWYECLWDLRDVFADMVDISHFADVRFLLFAVSNFILYSWYHVPYVFIADKAVEMGFSEGHASLLIAILGILNTFGEILLGWMGDLPWVNAGMVYALCMGACGVVTIIVPLLTSYVGLCIASGGFGLSIAANYALASIIIVELISLDRFTNAYGLLLFVQGTANLVGPPIAGWLYDVTGDYDLSFYLAGIFIIFCGILLVILPTMKWCKRRNRARAQDAIAAAQNNRAPKRDGLVIASETEKLPV